MAWVDASCGFFERSARARSRPMSLFVRVADARRLRSAWAVLRRYSRSVDSCLGRMPTPVARFRRGSGRGRAVSRCARMERWPGIRRFQATRRSSSLRRRRGRSVRRHAHRIPGQDRRQKLCVLRHFSPSHPRRPYRRCRGGRRPAARSSSRPEFHRYGARARWKGSSKRSTGATVREAGLRDRSSDRQARTARHRPQTVGVRRLRLPGNRLSVTQAKTVTECSYRC